MFTSSTLTYLNSTTAANLNVLIWPLTCSYEVAHWLLFTHLGTNCHTDSGTLGGCGVSPASLSPSLGIYSSDAGKARVSLYFPGVLASHQTLVHKPPIQLECSPLYIPLEWQIRLGSSPWLKLRCLARRGLLWSPLSTKQRKHPTPTPPIASAQHFHALARELFQMPGSISFHPINSKFIFQMSEKTS